MNKKELEEKMHVIFGLAIILFFMLIFVLAFVIDSNMKINETQDSIKNKTLESNQTLAYELGYTEGYYQCVGEVQQLQWEGKL